MSSVTAFEVVDHIIWDGGDSFHGGTLNHETGLRPFRLSLRADPLPTNLGLCLQLIIADFPQLKLLLTPRRLDVLHPDMNPLPNDPVPDLAITTEASSGERINQRINGLHMNSVNIFIPLQHNCSRKSS